MKPKLIAHGGAWDWDDEVDAIKREGLAEAVQAGQAILKVGGSAVDAVCATVVALENNPVFDAGTGGYLNRAGDVQLDALLVDGSRFDFGAVGGVTGVRNPILLARTVLEETDHCFFVGGGAHQLATEFGIETVENDQLVTDAMRRFYEDQRTDGPSDTVGAVAMDSAGNMAAATSTSGTPFKPAGRVGDSPLLGAGGYAENRIGAVGATGLGENIMRLLLAKYVSDQLDNGLSAHEAAQSALAYADRRIANSMSGVIVIDAFGQLGVAHTTPKIAVGWFEDEGTIRTAMHAEEMYR